MKEYIIATLASLCFTNPAESNKGYSILSAQTQEEKPKTHLENTHKILNSPFNFNPPTKQDKIIYDTAPTKSIKVK